MEQACISVQHRMGYTSSSLLKPYQRMEIKGLHKKLGNKFLSAIWVAQLRAISRLPGLGWSGKTSLEEVITFCSPYFVTFRSLFMSTTVLGCPSLTSLLIWTRIDFLNLNSRKKCVSTWVSACVRKQTWEVFYAKYSISVAREAFWRGGLSTRAGR